MSTDRKLIGGVWYVREDTAENFSISTTDAIHYKGIVYEDSDVCFDAHLIDDFDAPTISFIDKRIPSRYEEFWDNANWMRAVLDGEPDAMKELPKGLEQQTIAFLKYLNEADFI
jgi:hypothetical protein